MSDAKPERDRLFKVFIATSVALFVAMAALDAGWVVLAASAPEPRWMVRVSAAGWFAAIILTAAAVFVLFRGGGAAVADPREPYGRLVHDTRLAHEADQAAAEGRARFHLGAWEERAPSQRELDMRIGSVVAAAERGRIAARIDALAAASGGQSHFAYRNAAHEIREGGRG